MKKVMLGVLVGLMLALAFWRASVKLDIQLEHFEDGSGRITYCLPDGLCQD